MSNPDAEDVEEDANGGEEFECEIPHTECEIPHTECEIPHTECDIPHTDVNMSHMPADENIIS